MYQVQFVIRQGGDEKNPDVHLDVVCLADGEATALEQALGDAIAADIRGNLDDAREKAKREEAVIEFKCPDCGALLPAEGNDPREWKETDRHIALQKIVNPYCLSCGKRFAFHVTWNIELARVEAA